MFLGRKYIIYNARCLKWDRCDQACFDNMVREYNLHVNAVRRNSTPKTKSQYSSQKVPTLFLRPCFAFLDGNS